MSLLRAGLDTRMKVARATDEQLASLTGVSGGYTLATIRVHIPRLEVLQ